MKREWRNDLAKFAPLQAVAEPEFYTWGSITNDLYLSGLFL